MATDGAEAAERDRAGDLAGDLRAGRVDVLPDRSIVLPLPAELAADPSLTFRRARVALGLSGAGDAAGVAAAAAACA